MAATPRDEILPGLLLGFHGTDRDIVERVLGRDLRDTANFFLDSLKWY